MNLGLTGKNALVMGSSQGIGKAVAQSLINEGANVCLSSRNPETLEKTKNEIGAVDYIPTDLTQAKAGRTLVETYLSKFPTIDILVINTGGPQKNNFSDVTSEQWQLDFNSLWMSSVESMQAALPKMQEQMWGRVLMITSVAGKEPMNGLTTSNGFRAGLMGLNKSISKEYAQFGITLNVILPGFTNTDRLKNLNLSDEFVKSIVPAGRLGEPNELADLATFLASEKAGYINGQSIAIDGGYLNSY